MKSATAIILTFFGGFALGETGPPSIWLVSIVYRSAEQKAMLDTVVVKVEEAGYNPEGFKAKILCNMETCTVDVYPEELETEEYFGVRGCPLKYCATLVYSKITQEIVETSHWR